MSQERIRWWLARRHIVVITWGCVTYYFDLVSDVFVLFSYWEAELYGAFALLLCCIIGAQWYVILYERMIVGRREGRETLYSACGLRMAYEYRRLVKILAKDGWDANVDFRAGLRVVEAMFEGLPGSCIQLSVLLLQREVTLIRGLSFLSSIFSALLLVRVFAWLGGKARRATEIMFAVGGILSLGLRLILLALCGAHFQRDLYIVVVPIVVAQLIVLGGVWYCYGIHETTREPQWSQIIHKTWFSPIHFMTTNTVMLFFTSPLYLTPPKTMKKAEHGGVYGMMVLGLLHWVQNIVITVYLGIETDAPVKYMNLDNVSFLCTMVTLSCAAVTAQTVFAHMLKADRQLLVRQMSMAQLAPDSIGNLSRQSTDEEGEVDSHGEREGDTSSSSEEYRASSTSTSSPRSDNNVV
eukprot:GFYU01004560.1.p1 GENE.GFYU01004560.1~~GFYU01004560.1.p1  ORF type:complete len:410 (-),score=22.51 GFYU01004560.1:826-2055(-)